MFTSKTHLPQLLDSNAYRCEEQHRQELSAMMLDSWHCIGVRQQAPLPGDFFTYRVFNRPLLTWHVDDEYQTFLNVCPHRFSTLTDACSGSSDRLVCQYHGWEFDRCGDTKKIPDAVSFKPLAKGQLGLTPVATRTLGSLIFVNLNPNPTPLEDFLGEQYSYVEEFFSGPRRLVLQVDQEHKANWKIVVENALESYHVSMVHRDTFGATAKAEACEHEFYTNGTKFIEQTRLQTSRLARFNRFLLKVIGFPHSDEYQHLLIYPNGMLTCMPPYSLVQWTYPVTATTSLSKWWVLGYFGEKGSIASATVGPLAASFGRRFFTTLLAEDLRVQEAVDRGLSSDALPRGGLISAREERIFHFQEMVAEKTGACVRLNNEKTSDSQGVQDA